MSSLDPFELGALAQAGVLASATMRIYDASPTGFLPGEGCGMLALMRSADARAADMPVYAEIVGWGVSSPGQRDVVSADPDASCPLSNVPTAGRAWIPPTSSSSRETGAAPRTTTSPSSLR